MSFLWLQLADFGLSNHFQRGTLLQTYCGSPLYAAPEIVKGLPYQGPEVGQHAQTSLVSLEKLIDAPQPTKAVKLWALKPKQWAERRQSMLQSWGELQSGDNSPWVRHYDQHLFFVTHHFHMLQKKHHSKRLWQNLIFNISNIRFHKAVENQNVGHIFRYSYCNFCHA